MNRSRIRALFLFLVAITLAINVSCINPLQDLILQDISQVLSQRFNLTIVSVGDGTTTPSGTIEVTEGQFITIIADPADGSAFDSWAVVSGENVVLDDAAELETSIMLSSEDATVEARFYIPDITPPGVTVSTS
ncbi:MAG: hypothetical protein E4H36_08905, partial [Spirochaetales bacterium]